MVWKEIRKTHQQVMPLRERFPNADKRLISLIKQILALDRHPPTPRELLRHKYFEGMDQSTIEDGPRGVTARLPWKVSAPSGPIDTAIVSIPKPELFIAGACKCH